VRPSQRALEPVAVAAPVSGLDASVEAFIWAKLYHSAGCYNPRQTIRKKR